MKIYTKTGDDGTSSVDGKKRLQKDDIIFNLLGSLDTLSCYLGLARSKADPRNGEIIRLQQELIIELSSCIAGYKTNSSESITGAANELEREIDVLTELSVLPSKLVVPGKTPESAVIDVARAETRNTERIMVSYSRHTQIPPEWLKWINRLSDYLYILARHTEFDAVIDNAVNGKKLTLQTAKTLINAIEKEAEKSGVKAAIAVCGENGGLICLHVMDGAYIISADAAMKKAYTAAALKMPTANLKVLSAPGGMFYGIEAINDKILVIGGGEVLETGSEGERGAKSKQPVCGGIGVSGGTDIQDIELARFGKELFENL